MAPHPTWKPDGKTPEKKSGQSLNPFQPLKTWQILKVYRNLHSSVWMISQLDITWPRRCRHRSALRMLSTTDTTGDVGALCRPRFCCRKGSNWPKPNCWRASSTADQDPQDFKRAWLGMPKCIKMWGPWSKRNPKNNLDERGHGNPLSCSTLVALVHFRAYRIRKNSKN